MGSRKRPRCARIENLEPRLFFHTGETKGTGLLGQYFDNKDFTAPVLSRTDANVNFNWGYNAPAAGMGVDTFSVRWSGQVVPHTTDNYTFSTTSDDGVRLWINGKLVIDKLINQSTTTYKTAPIALTAGQAVDVRLDYFDNGGQAKVQLMWSTPTLVKEIIPQDHLFPGMPPTPPPPPPPSAIRIDAAGSKPYTDVDGKTWIADKYYSGGSTRLGLFAISGTTDDVMYATRRFGKSFSYAIPLTPGDYKLNLLFADESFAAGGRLINASAEGKQILTKFDIVGEAGKGVAITKSFDITSDGTLNLSFTGVLQNATLSAIEIIPASSVPAIDWKTVAPSPAVRAESLGRVVNGKLYVMGGLTNDSTGKIIAMTRCDVYDPTTDTWTQLADEPEAITHAGVVVDGSDIWFVGGYIGDHPGPGSAHVWKYDTLTNTWTAGPDLPAARGAGAAAIVDRKLHFFGGMDETRATDEADHWVLDLTPPPPPVVDPENPDAPVEPPPPPTWTTAAPLPNARNHVAAGSLDGKIYVLGGQHAQESAQDAQSEVDCYDPATDTWTRLADLPSPRSHVNASTFVMNGKIIVLGGENGYNLPQSTIYSYDPATNPWTLIGLLPANRSTSVAGVLPDGRIITSTGNTPNPSVATWIGTLI
jgi:N-acetylneuraminic acid mutarotase